MFTDEDKKRIGSKIRRMRQDKGIPLSHIANYVGLHRANYSKIESGEQNISLYVGKKLAEFYNITVEELYK